MDTGNMLKPMLARGELHCIGATTLDEYREYIEKDAALERRFQPVQVDEPTVERTLISILRGIKKNATRYSTELRSLMPHWSVQQSFRTVIFRIVFYRIKRLT